MEIVEDDKTSVFVRMSRDEYNEVDKYFRLKGNLNF